MIDDVDIIINAKTCQCFHSITTATVYTAILIFTITQCVSSVIIYQESKKIK